MMVLFVVVGSLWLRVTGCLKHKQVSIVLRQNGQEDYGRGHTNNCRSWNFVQVWRVSESDDLIQVGKTTFKE